MRGMVRAALFISMVYTSGAWAQYEPATATNLSLNGSASGTMDDNHSDYWWTVTLPSDGSLVVNTNAVSGLDIDPAIYEMKDGEYYWVAGHDVGGSGPDDATHSSNLAAGTYYINAYRYIGTGGYTITSTFTPTALEDDVSPNDSAAVATTLAYNGNDTGHLGFYGARRTDTEDWWKVTLSVDGKLIVATHADSTLDIDPAIYEMKDSEYYWVAGHDVGGSGPDDSTHGNNLQAGTYYICAYGYNGYGSYTITSTFTPTALEDDISPNDSAAVATTLAYNGTDTGHLGFYGARRTDTEDWWKVTIPDDGKLVVATRADATLDIDLALYEKKGDAYTWVAGHDVGGPGPDDSTHCNNLRAGTYYIRAYGYNGYGSYTITPAFTPARYVTDAEPNDSQMQTTPISINAGTPGRLGYYANGFTDTADWFTFTVPTGWDSLLVRVMSDSTLEADITLYDAGGNQIAHDGRNGIESFISIPTPPVGAYSLNLYEYTGYGSYIVTVSSTSAVSVTGDVLYAFRVNPPYPNPFNPSTTIVYELPEKTVVRITVFDTLGREVAVLENTVQQPGFHETVWNGRTESGDTASSGLYFFRLEAGHRMVQGKMILMK